MKKIITIFFILLSFSAYSVVVDIDELTKKADSGDHVSQYRLAARYYGGIDVDKNYSKALKYFRLAALQNHALSQFMIGQMYNYGQDVKQNKTEAKEWYRKACDNGFKPGCANYNLK